MYDLNNSKQLSPTLFIIVSEYIQTYLYNWQLRRGTIIDQIYSCNWRPAPSQGWTGSQLARDLAGNVIGLILLHTECRHPPDISRDQKMPTDNNRRHQTQTDSPRHPKTLTSAVWVQTAVSVGVCCCLLASLAPWRCLGGVWGMSGGVWSRDKVMSRKTNKLQAPVLEYLIYSRHLYLQKSKNSFEKLINSCKHKRVPKQRKIKPKHILQ